MLKHLPVPADGPPLSAGATRAAVGLAREAGARIATASMAEPLPYSVFSKPAFLPDHTGCQQRMQDRARRHVEEVAEVRRDGVDRLFMGSAIQAAPSHSTLPAKVFR